MLNLLKTEEIDKVVTPVVRRNSVERDRMTAWLNERIAASKKKPSAEVVTLTPVLAELLLERNPINRPISRRNANDLASDIATGRFQFNGESIVVSNSGVLLDGQHRCEQVVTTGKTIETVIVFGPKDEARFTIDTGRPKTVSNYLHMKGRVYTGYLAAAVGYVLQWKEHGSLNYGGDVRPTKAAVLEAADELRGIDESVSLAVTGMKSVRSGAVLAFCHYAFWKRSTREAADHFLIRLIEGDGLRKGDPILYCRNKLIGMGRGVDANSRAEMIFKCWNAHRLGQTVTAFRLTGGKLPKLER